eukprot:gene6751-biopygen19454
MPVAREQLGVEAGRCSVDAVAPDGGRGEAVAPADGQLLLGLRGALGPGAPCVARAHTHACRTHAHPFRVQCSAQDAPASLFLRGTMLPASGPRPDARPRAFFPARARARARAPVKALQPMGHNSPKHGHTALALIRSVLVAQTLASLWAVSASPQRWRPDSRPGVLQVRRGDMCLRANERTNGRSDGAGTGDGSAEPETIPKTAACASTCKFACTSACTYGNYHS